MGVDSKEHSSIVFSGILAVALLLALSSLYHLLPYGVRVAVILTKNYNKRVIRI